jgi:hypothetical protein
LQPCPSPLYNITYFRRIPLDYGLRRPRYLSTGHPRSVGAIIAQWSSSTTTTLAAASPPQSSQVYNLDVVPPAPPAPTPNDANGYVSVPFEAFCATDQAQEDENGNTHKVPLRQRPLLTVDFGHVVWLDGRCSSDAGDSERAGLARRSTSTVSAVGTSVETGDV